MTWRPGELLRRTAERVCSRRTMEHLVLPILADLQAEHADASARGRRFRAFAVLLQSYAAFWKAVAVHGALTSVRHLRDNALAAPTNRTVLSRVLLRASASLVVLTLLLGAHFLPGKELLSAMLARNSYAITFLLPGILCVTIPMSVFLGILLTLTGASRTTWRPLRHILALATLAAVANFAGMAFTVPRANQAFREAAFNVVVEPKAGGRTTLSKGVRELTLPELSDAIRTLRLEGRERDTIPFEVEWHKKFAVSATCVVLALLAVGAMPRTRAAALALFVVVIFTYYLQLRVGEQFANRGVFSPVIAMWSGNALFATLGALLLSKRRLRERAGA